MISTNRHESLQGQAVADADDRGFTDRRVPHPAGELLAQLLGDFERAAVWPLDVFADQQHAVVGG